ncbi:MAG: phosphoribosylamine--glycine ligase [Zymomonas mobilis subsp. pomaceae]|uniref:Phosphoribosylamine--glycine ligase n=1 Tax=Zymomonas mobilis subsp. pomaceae (strain ATCC 29192 / DSM 22645 / JCM 10191 / CCUG 17912 / NBRC 13757 / NCIMB 11200 / NRRL B-4491 / Barker I) TaxID=579138 RepID=F8ESL2_ZYMMT|nr:phosphoribosylamine--glycine ligase [Zymomonas mobilis]AEI37787.1 phosphoribosylamine/glycine ligase [Zymomonas mobilis subsp. pomaceae ATCC 29192]MDX5949154.1 phosphoribosylamine--glycine ligase [Zymomonas mobilis subsp. pomaceae]GEB89790.1 phosphoribosylamine--glycine ligase [Zymomonas mobilis subsp. pomaceae]
MNVLLIGTGGREHALAWKIAQSPSLDTLYATTGNPGIAKLAKPADLIVTDHKAVVDFCKNHKVDLVIIGPEAPLVDGLGDSLRAADIAAFGPDKAAAQLEGSKGFTKDLCARYDIPTARYQRCRNALEAKAALNDFGLPVVIKADGLAGGKGVIIAESRTAAETAIDEMTAGSFGKAGLEIVVEEFMQGEEASFFAISDGQNVYPFGTARDHKRVGDGDTGPNTGGMGAYSPATRLTADIEQQVMQRIIVPTVQAMKQEGAPFIGILYAGLMLTKEGPKLIEYNARLGDPECQLLMLRLEDDILPLFYAAAQGQLEIQPAPRFSSDHAVTVVMAAKGYPASPVKGGSIQKIEDAEKLGAIVFQAGTKLDGEILKANGGRVLNVTATAKDFKSARALAYQAVAAIDYPDGFWRKDIGL